MKPQNVAAFVLMLIMMICTSIHAAFGANEIIHFWISFPTGIMIGPKIIRIDETVITLDINEHGLLKKIFNGHVEALFNSLNIQCRR